jgi:iron complex transport system substrate-binding protein
MTPAPMMHARCVNKGTRAMRTRARMRMPPRQETRRWPQRWLLFRGVCGVCLVAIAIAIAIATATTIAAAAAAAAATAAATTDGTALAPSQAAASPLSPGRIVSTSPSITETLFALGLGDRVVGVSRYCRFPSQVSALPKIGTFLKPDAELIARLRPDLVIVHAGPSGIDTKLTTLGIPFIRVERGALSSVFSTIRDIGKVAGVDGRAQALIGTLESHLDNIRRRVAGKPVQKVLVIVGRRASTSTDLVAVGRNSYLTDIITIAGGVNVLAGESPTDYPRISMETVYRLAPDVIIDAGEMGDAVDDPARRQIAIQALWLRAGAGAARTGRVHAVTSEAFVVPGPRVTEVAETIASWLHPEHAASAEHGGQAEHAAPGGHERPVGRAEGREQPR